MTSADMSLFGASPFDAIRQLDDDGDFWSARDLMPLLGYERWERFEAAISRAYAACKNSGHEATDHFRGAAKNPSELGGRPALDWRLTRYACYLVAMNGDPRKPEIAAAQSYFAAKTREAEIAAPAALDMSTAAGRMQVLSMAMAAEERALAAETKAAELEGPAHAWDVLASGSGDLQVADAAKILSRDPGINLGRDRLFAYMAGLGWVHRQRSDNRWRAYQSQVDNGRLSELPQQYENPQTGELTLGAPQVRVTPKGLRELHKRLGGTADIREPVS